MLFDTPLLNLGANTPAAAASSSTPSSSHKRKRSPSTSTPSATPDKAAKVQQGEVNLDKLLKKIKQDDSSRAQSGGGGQQGQGKAKKQKKSDAAPAEQKQQQGGAAKEQAQPQVKAGKKGKKGKKGGAISSQAHSSDGENDSASAPTGTAPVISTPIPGMTLMRFAAPSQTLPSPSSAGTASAKKGSVQDKLRAQLAGGKFRMLNEQLYTTSGGDAHRLMNEEGAFDDYHTGFRSQAATWPVHPLALIAQSLLSSLEPNSLVADFGCGDAALARTLSPSAASSSSAAAASALPPIPSLKVPAKQIAAKRLKVVSFDLVSQSSFVVEAECASVPLPGGTAGGEVVDAVVCCLSLMGTDWVGMVREARRVLRVGGVLKIAEVTSRFPSLDDFIKLLTSLGFSLTHRDESNSHFVLFDFEKTEAGEPAGKVDEHSRKAAKLLNPCIYKRR
ncbi:hypothetical protein JCM10207_005998 [Rhodosporidiobolus poonsookiae]